MNLKPELASPVRGKPIITSPYGWRVLNGQRQFHDGIDFVSAEASIKDRLNPVGTDVFAVADGVVTSDYDKYDDRYRMDLNGHRADSAGNMVIVLHTIGGAKYYTRYLHLVTNTVSAGQKIAKGYKIGMYADVGFSFGPHLHFDMYTLSWTKVDPTPIIFT